MWCGDNKNEAGRTALHFLIFLNHSRVPSMGLPGSACLVGSPSFPFLLTDEETRLAMPHRKYESVEAYLARSVFMCFVCNVHTPTFLHSTSPLR